MSLLRRRKKPGSAARTPPERALPEGVLLPTRLRRYRIYRLDERAFQIWRDDHCDVGSYVASSLESVVEAYMEREAHEDETSVALATGNPKAMCRIGWHRMENYVGWFALANGGHRGNLLVYWMGSAPFRYRCRSIMVLDGQPVSCGICGREIDAKTAFARDRWIPQADRPRDPGKRGIPELFNDHDENGVCQHCHVPLDHPVFQGWKRVFAPGQVEQLQTDRREPHRIDDGFCKDCGHDAGRPRSEALNEMNDPKRLLAEHQMGQHQSLNRGYCPECEPIVEARRAEWHAVHGAEIHSCPECEEMMRWDALDRVSSDHRAGKHTIEVRDCERCKNQLEHRRKLAAHAEGGHEDFDYRDKYAIAPCSSCLKQQWDWYETVQARPEGSAPRR
jgi:hypothetical protein